MLIISLGLAFADFRIRADADGENGAAGFRCPFTQGLSHQSNGRSQKENETFSFGLIFRDLQRGVGFTCTACHNQFATIVALEMLMECCDCSLLMRSRRFFALPCLSTTDPFLQYRPIHRSALKISKTNSLNRGFLVPDGIFCLTPPFVGRGNPETQSKGSRLQLVVDELLAGCCQKTVHSRFVDSSFFVIALALDSPILSIIGQGN